MSMFRPRRIRRSMRAEGADVDCFFLWRLIVFLLGSSALLNMLSSCPFRLMPTRLSGGCDYSDEGKCGNRGRKMRAASVWRLEVTAMSAGRQMRRYELIELEKVGIKMRVVASC